jgi:NAD-dependent deacetylase
VAVAGKKEVRVFVLTGAGISAESGLGTFRDPGGVWERFDPMKLATPEAFAADPEPCTPSTTCAGATCSPRPNPAHAALARLEAGSPRRGGGLFLCTQNIDDLHERAGSVPSTTCTANCSRRAAPPAASGPWREDLAVDDPLPACGRAGGMRPDVVWFGEMPIGLDEIEEALAESDLFVAIGTSGSVYPAAGFVESRGPAGCGRPS